jgi:hypothetical protein
MPQNSIQPDLHIVSDQEDYNWAELAEAVALSEQMRYELQPRMVRKEKIEKAFQKVSVRRISRYCLLIASLAAATTAVYNHPTAPAKIENTVAQELPIAKHVKFQCYATRNKIVMAYCGAPGSEKRQRTVRKNCHAPTGQCQMTIKPVRREDIIIHPFNSPKEGERVIVYEEE